MHPPISFSQQDLTDFSNASGDRNPLHLSNQYALRTPYGQQVVFGCLGAIAGLGRIRLPDGWTATGLQAEFLRPMFLDIPYRVEILQKEGSWSARLYDGTLPVLSVVLTGGLLEQSNSPEGWQTAASPRREAFVWKSEQIVPGLTISGEYSCNPGEIAQRWGCDPFLAGILCWSSYLVGMELPGETALFSKLNFRFHAGRRTAKWAYHASVAAVDARFDQIRLQVSLDGVASGECWSFLRPAVPLEEADSEERSSSLAGRIVAVIGASRGLGAAVKQALEKRGASVYSVARSSGEQATEVGDAADPEVLKRLRERIRKEHGHLDFLICNACPPILPLRLEESAAGRIGDYISRAIGLCLIPICVFSELLNTSQGCLVTISSAVVDQPVREWPHYTAAKQAVEALTQVAALQYPGLRTLIVRPPKLLTSMTNTPMGRMGATSPREFARHIAARLENPLDAGKTEVLK